MAQAQATKKEPMTLLDCPVKVTIAVMGGKWKPLILYHLLNGGVHRFAALRRKIAGISERVLTQQLRELEADGIVHREVYPEVPPKVEYSITAYGETLRPVSEAMCAWGLKHSQRSQAYGRPKDIATVRKQRFTESM